MNYLSGHFTYIVEMDINILSLGILGLGIAYMGYQMYTTPLIKELQIERSGLLVAQDTANSKQIQSKTGDASMTTERIRRKVIHANGIQYRSRIKESRTQTGSTTGAIEMMLSGICPHCYDIIFDGGNDTGEYCQFVGDGYLDAGNARTKVYGV